ncbi:MAG TPA: zinc-dependent metalloprotease [Chitinophagaceae bacterium]|nr:zinc-dependent metalloprotease [Chitinophagaceae bacterium]
MKNLYKFLLMIFALTGTFIAKSQVTELNSYPSASNVILLDFDGHAVSGTMWNTSGAFTCNSSGLSDAAIIEVFNRVAEDYRPFSINVTTSETKYNSAPFNKRMRVVITTSNEWYGSGAGGVAYINSFTWGDNTPCFVFSALLSYSIKNVAEAASHEAGHTLGLRHQSSYNAACTKLSDYNWGQGTGEIGWAPIMGAGYNQNLTLWNSGPNSLGCGVIQDDLSVITNATNGFGYRTDDHTDVFSTATSATFNSSGQAVISGVIEKTDDKDLFKITVPIFSRLQLNAIPYNVGTGNSGSDLDLQVDFLDGSHASIGTYNPGNLLSSVIDTFINAGTYYMRIDGKGNIYAPEYGSLGSYSLQATYTNAAVLDIRRLELRGRLNGDMHTLSWLIEADEPVMKQVVEVSNNGVNFTPLDQPNNALRTYSYHPLDNRPLLYRLHITLNNSKEYYSNVIAIRQGKTLKPQLIGNTISGNYITINSPANYHYQIIDQSGRMLSKGAVEKGYSSLGLGSINTGIYIIRFTDGEQQWSEKFIKR